MPRDVITESAKTPKDIFASKPQKLMIGGERPGLLERFATGAANIPLSLLQGLQQAGTETGQDISKAEVPLRQKLGLPTQAPTKPLIDFKQIQLPSAKTVPEETAGAAGGILGSVPFFAAPEAAVGRIPELATMAGKAGKLVRGIARSVVAGGVSADITPEAPVSGAIAGLAGSGLAETIGPMASGFTKLFTRSPTRVAGQDFSKIIAKNPAILETAAKRAGIAKKIGVGKLTAGSLTGEPLIQSREELLAKGVGGEDAARFQKEVANINNKINVASDKIVNKLGGKEKTAFAIGSDVNDILRKTKKASLKKISAIYDAASNAVGNDTQIPHKEILDTAEEIKDTIPGFVYPKSVQQPLDEIAINKKLDVEGANKLIRGANAAIRNNTGQEAATLRYGISRVLSQTLDSLDTLGDNENVGSRDLFKLARSSRKSLGDVFDQKDVIQDLVANKGRLTAKVAPEKVLDKIFGTKNSITNISKIEDALKFNIDIAGNKIPNPEGAEVWNDLRQNHLQNIVDKSKIGGVLNAKRLVTNIKRTGPEAWEKIIGSKKVADNFNDLIKVMDFVQDRPPGTINYSNTANVLAKMGNFVNKSIIKHIPFIGKPLSALREIADSASNKKWVENNLRFNDRIKTLQKNLKTIKSPLIKDKHIKAARLGLLSTISNLTGGEQQ